MYQLSPKAENDFYPRSPCGERPFEKFEGVIATKISIHALLAESDANWFDLWGWAEYFYPRSPCGERRCRRCNGQSISGISIHALLAESDRSADCNCRNARPISIHALLAESDDPAKSESLTTYLISIHALLAESDRMFASLFFGCFYFYPRSPCGERRSNESSEDADDNFYPRSPCGERHTWVRGSRITYVISIHALLAESDALRQLQSALCRNFYPRSPCGERPLRPAGGPA